MKLLFFEYGWSKLRTRVQLRFKKNISPKEQGSRRVKIGPVAEIYDFFICYRIIYLMKKNVIFICLALKLCDIEADK